MGERCEMFKFNFLMVGGVWWWSEKGKVGEEQGKKENRKKL